MPEIKKILILFFIAAIAACTGCKEGPPDPVDEGMKITGVSIPGSLNVPAGGEITLTGSGFAINDQIVFVLTSDAGMSFTAVITAVTDRQPPSPFLQASPPAPTG